MNSTKPQVGIAAAAVAFPRQRISSREVAQAESIDPAAVASLGIEEVPVCDEETASSLARLRLSFAAPGLCSGLWRGRSCWRCGPSGHAY